MEQLSFQYSGWFLVACLAIGVLYALFLYVKENKFGNYSRWWLWLLSFLRFALVSGLCFLLLGPFIKTVDEEIKKPIVVTLEDKSMSVGKSTDLAAYQESLTGLKTTLGNAYELYSFDFGDEITKGHDTLTHEYKVTNISEALEYVYDNFNDQNLGAIILASDGIFNEGQNPVYQNLNFKAPLYTIGLGDTTIRRDAAVKHVYHNKIAYLNDQFTIQADVQVRKALGQNVRLQVLEDQGGSWKILNEKNLRVDKDDFFITEDFVLDAKTPGVRRYRVKLGQLNNEESTGNNVFDFYIEVLDARLKILMYAAAPHPDIAALKTILTNNVNYEVELNFASMTDQPNFSTADFVIFHNLPSGQTNIDQVLSILNRKKTPRLFVVGEKTDLDLFSKAQSTVTISGNNVQSNEVQALLNPSFNLFTLEDQTKNFIPKYVPLSAPFGEYKIGPKTEVFAYQKIGTVDTKYPLISFSDDAGIKTAIISAQGIWRWKLFEFAQNDNFDLLNDLLDKTISYTSVKEDKRKFRVTTTKNIFKENERIRLDAEFYNNSYQRLNEPEAFLTIKNRKAEEFKYVFSKSNESYQLDAGFFPDGNYTYTAELNYNGERFSQSGKFTVQAILLELNNLTADHNLLNNLSERYGGELYAKEDVSNLEDLLINTNKLKPVMYASSKTRSIMHYKWLFFALFLFLGLEWFLRRYFGSY